MNNNVHPPVQRGEAKTARIPIKAVAASASALRKPDWIRVGLPASNTFRDVMRILREQGLHTVCEEASCPNIAECFSKGTATFMILGRLCTRRCPFCDVAHGRPSLPDPDEPLHLAQTVAQAMGFLHAACGPLVRSSYHADDQAYAAGMD